MMVRCPQCGNDDAFEYYEYGITVRYIGIFKEGIRSIAMVDIYNTRAPAMYARCCICRKRFKLEVLEEDSTI